MCTEKTKFSLQWRSIQIPQRHKKHSKLIQASQGTQKALSMKCKLQIKLYRRVKCTMTSDNNMRSELAAMTRPFLDTFTKSTLRVCVIWAKRNKALGSPCSLIKHLIKAYNLRH